MPVLNWVLPLASSILSFVFAGFVLDQWQQRRRAFQLVWALGLTSYGIGAGTEFLGAAIGWNGGLYRAWYLFGALLVAAYLGAGTVYLLSRTPFGYFAAFAVFSGGLFAQLSQLRLLKEGLPAPQGDVDLVIEITTVAAVAIVVVAGARRQLAGHVVMGLLVAATAIVALLVLTAPLPGPGFALDPVTQVPVGTAMPAHLRIVSGPFNIAGALCLVFGAVYSVYVYMPKRKVLGARFGALAVLVNLVASLPRAFTELLQGRLNSRVPATLLIALGGLVPSLTSGLNRFGVTWAFFLGEFVGILLIFAGFLVSEEVFRNLRLPALTLWQRREGTAESG